MFDEIGKVDSVTRPELLKTNRDRSNNQANSNGQSPSANPEEKAQKENDEEQDSTHLLDVRI
jgi:hypothetical protein